MRARVCVCVHVLVSVVLQLMDKICPLVVLIAATFYILYIVSTSFGTVGPINV